MYLPGKMAALVWPEGTSVLCLPRKFFWGNCRAMKRQVISIHILKSLISKILQQFSSSYLVKVVWGLPNLSFTVIESSIHFMKVHRVYLQSQCLGRTPNVVFYFLIHSNPSFCLLNSRCIKVFLMSIVKFNPLSSLLVSPSLQKSLEAS